MPLIINTNISSLNTQRHLTISKTELTQVMEKLSSGKRLNSARDDAAGLSIVNQFRAESATITQAIRNANDAISIVNTAEGSLDSVQGMLTRIRELTVQAANDTLDTNAKKMLEDESHHLMFEIDRIKDVTSFNGARLLDGSFTDVPFYLGSANATTDLLITINGSTTNRLFSIPDATFENGTFDLTTPVDNGDGTFSVAGWTINTNQVRLGTDSIGGFVSPESPVYPSNNVNDTDGVGVTNDEQVVSNWGGSYSSVTDGIRLNTGGMTIKNYGVAHGPYIISDTYTEIKAGAQVSFDWSAVAGGDDYDVYGYLLKDDGTTIELLDSHGRSGSGAETVTVNSAGNYKFVFVAGTFDASGGTAAGASFDISNVNVTGNEPASPYGDIINYSTPEGIATSLSKIDEAFSMLLADRASLGALGNRIEHTLSSLFLKGEKLTEATSLINDADYAAESARLAKLQVLEQSSTAMLSQANASIQKVLDLLK